MENMECQDQHMTFFTPDARVGSLGVEFSGRICGFDWAKIPESIFDAIRLSEFLDSIEIPLRAKVWEGQQKLAGGISFSKKMEPKCGRVA